MKCMIPKECISGLILSVCNLFNAEEDKFPKTIEPFKAF